MTTATDPFGLGGILDGLGNPERENELSATVDRLTARVRELESRAAALIELCADPEQAHRMITRKEIMRTLKGEPLS